MNDRISPLEKNNAELEKVFDEFDRVKSKFFESLINKIQKITDETPNDWELGVKIRKIFCESQFDKLS